MSEYDRHFSRRNITWKLTDVTRESIEERKRSPEFAILLGDNKTEWFLQTRVENQHLGVYLSKAGATRIDFFITFIVSIVKVKKSPACKYSISFAGKCNELYKETSSGRGFPKFISLDDLLNEDNQLLVGNELTLEMQVELIEDSKVKVPEENRRLNNLAKLVNNKKYSDFVFICSDGGKVYVQQAIIAVNCEAFEAMINAGWSETETGSANIADVDFETMLELVRFLYIGRVENMKQVQRKLVIAANKYGLEDLQALCVSSLMESLTYSNVHNVFEIAKLLGEDHLKKNCIDFIKCHRSRFEFRLKGEDFSKELLWAIWKSDDPIRFRFENDKMM